MKEIKELELAESIFNIFIGWMHLKSTVFFVLVNYLQETNNNVTKILTSWATTGLAWVNSQT